MCLVCIGKQTAIISLHSINGLNWLRLIMEMDYVHCAVRTESSGINNA